MDISREKKKNQIIQDVSFVLFLVLTALFFLFPVSVDQEISNIVEIETDDGVKVTEIVYTTESVLYQSSNENFDYGASNLPSKKQGVDEEIRVSADKRPLFMSTVLCSHEIQHIENIHSSTGEDFLHEKLKDQNGEYKDFYYLRQIPLLDLKCFSSFL